MLRRSAVAVSLCLVALVATSASPARLDAPGKSSFIGPFTGVGIGGETRVGHSDNKSTNPDNHVVSDSNESYQGQFNYSFRIENGAIIGIGNGDYKTASWDLSGTNGKEGAFSCSPPVSTHPFAVRVSGWAVDNRMYPTFDLLDAEETNADYDCGAKFTGFATTSHFLIDSLVAVQDNAVGGLIATTVRNPSIGHLAFHEETASGNATHVIDSAWDITISGPSGGKDNPGGPGPSTAKRKGKGTKVCTINGTPGNDRLTGTSKHDVICGFGGNDVIKAGGDDDIVFGGPGNDSIDGGAGKDLLFGDAGKDALSAKDGERDRVVGGPGKDRAKVDKGKDTVGAVESVSG